MAMPEAVGGSHSLWRVYTILAEARRHPNTAALQAWGVILGIDPGNLKGIRTIIRRLLTLQEELLRALDRMTVVPVTRETYKFAFDAAHQALSLHPTRDSMGQLHAIVTEEVLRTLLMCAQLLPLEEGWLSDDARQELWELIDDMREVLDHAPDPLRAALTEQLNAMGDALECYSVSGIQPLRRATYGLEGALSAHLDLERPGESEVVTRLKHLVQVAKATVAACAMSAGVVLALPNVGEVLADTELYYRGVRAIATESADADHGAESERPVRALKSGAPDGDRSQARRRKSPRDAQP